MIRGLIGSLAATAMLVLLGSCASDPARETGPAESAAVPAVVAPRLELLAEVRAAANDAGDVIEVQPLRDPAVEDLRAEAAEAEQRGDFPAAAQALEQALELAPDDPQLMQEFAELLLAQDRLGDAEELAGRSFGRGPKLGGLCRRNWTTIQVVRQASGDPQGASDAADQVARCIVEPPVRM